MRIFIVAMALVIGGSGMAQARCADDLKELQARIDREKLRQPTPPPVMAAAKELQKANANMAQMDEVDCYNAVAHARRTLATPPPAPAVKAEK